MISSFIIDVTCTTEPEGTRATCSSVPLRGTTSAALKLTPHRAHVLSAICQAELAQ